MAPTAPDSGSARLSPPTWLSVLAWIYLMAFGLRLITDLAQGAIDYDPLRVTVGINTSRSLGLPVWWAVVHMGAEVCFGIGCLAVLLRDRDLAWFAIVGGWAIAVLQCCDAFAGVFHLQFAIPLSAAVYAAIAWRTASLLRVEPPVRPGSLGTV